MDSTIGEPDAVEPETTPTLLLLPHPRSHLLGLLRRPVLSPPGPQDPKIAPETPADAGVSVSGQGAPPYRSITGHALRVEAINEKSILVTGDTQTHKDRIKKLRGLWNKERQGWVFPKKREAQVRKALKDLLAAPSSIGGRSITDPGIQAALRSMAAQAGWAQRGGELLRDENDNVVGRTTWVPNDPWYAELPERLNREATIEAVRKAIAGERLGAKERRVVDYMLDAIERSREEGALSPEEGEVQSATAASRRGSRARGTGRTFGYHGRGRAGTGGSARRRHKHSDRGG